MSQDSLPDTIDNLVEEAVFGATELAKKKAQHEIRGLASTRQVVLSSIQGLYEAAGRGLYQDITVPAINIRGITYHVARAVFRAARKQ